MADPLMIAQSRLEAAYMDLDLNNRQLSIDPEIAKLILELALKVLVKCQASNGQATNLVSDRPVLARLIIRRHVAEELRSRYGFGGWRHKDGPRLSEAILVAAVAAQPEEIDQLLTTARMAVE